MQSGFAKCFLANRTFDSSEDKFESIVAAYLAQIYQDFELSRHAGSPNCGGLPVDMVYSVLDISCVYIVNIINILYILNIIYIFDIRDIIDIFDIHDIVNILYI